MPKSKKPRKPHRRKGCIAALMIPPQVIENIHSLARRVELAVEIKLPMGNASFEDVDGIRCMINLSTISLITRDYLDDDYREAAMEKIRTMREHFKTFYERVLTKNCYTCTADELNAIREGIEIAGDLVHYSLDNEPFRFFKEYKVMNDLVGDAGDLSQMRVPVTTEKLVKELKK